MKIISGSLAFKKLHVKNCVVTLGNFDGVHRGHLAVIDRCRRLAGPDQAVAMVTFEPLPQAFFRPDQAPARLTTVYQKLGLLGAAGVDITWLMRFDARLAGLGAREFIQHVLIRGLAVQQVVVGADFRFGKGSLTVSASITWSWATISGSARIG